MAYFKLYCWPYHPDRDELAKQHFEKAKEGINNLNLGEDVSFCLARNVRHDTGIFVLYLVGEYHGGINDSNTQIVLDEFFNKCGCPKYQDSESPNIGRDATSAENFADRMMECGVRVLQGPVIKWVNGEVITIDYPGQVIARLANPDYKIRTDASRALGVLRDQRAIEPLITAMNDEDFRVRRSVVDALASFRDARTVEPLVTALKDEDSLVRESAAERLKNLKDVRAVEPLIAALKDDSISVRRTAASALGELNDVRAVMPLIEALNEKDSYLRRYAARSLGELKDSRAIEPLIPLLKTEDKDEQKVVANALKELSWEAPPESEGTVSPEHQASLPKEPVPAPAKSPVSPIIQKRQKTFLYVFLAIIGIILLMSVLGPTLGRLVSP